MTDTSPATVAPGAVAIPDDDDGLGDFDTSDMVVPRMRLIGDEGVFQDNLTNEKFEEVEVILLGLVKQRILWPPEVGEEASAPLCRSADAATGVPNPEVFPWAEAGFEDNSGAAPGSVMLPCVNCSLKEWGSHPKQDTPWCSEQYTLASLIPRGSGDERVYAPAIFTFQRSALSSCRSYLSAFKGNKQPLFTVYTTISLERKRRGSVRYAVPKFVKGGETDQALWGDYKAQYQAMRSYLQTIRATEPTEDTPPASATSPAATAVAVEDDDDLPF